MNGTPRKRYVCKDCGSVGYLNFYDGRCDVCDVKYLWHQNTLNAKRPPKRIMTPDELYVMGYEDGKQGKSANASYTHDPNYEMGYLDGKGDRAADRPVDEDFTAFNDPPAGFEFTGAKRVASPGDWYLTKNGNAKQQIGYRKNSQTRHILRKI